MAGTRPIPDFDVVVVGGGIVGLATAYGLTKQRPDLSLVLLEKESGPARHQTGRNSGVIHSGLYYRPGSNKAEMVALGRERLLDFCADHQIEFELCGKLVVATDDTQLSRLEALAERGAANGLSVERLSPSGLREHEPHVAGIAGLHVPAAGIVDFGQICAAVARDLLENGHVLRFDAEVTSITNPGERVVVGGAWGSLTARLLVNCAGLHSDRVAALAGVDLDGLRIMPFRGEFFGLSDAASRLVRNLIYPVPDPTFPFLGVHLTRMIGGGVHAGPNAVPALSREGYRWRDLNRRDLFETFSSSGTWRLGRQYWRTGAAELWRSLSKRSFVTAVQQLVPELAAADLSRSRAGVRAQAIRADGTLEDDFVIRASACGVHVLNAPSPAATAAFEIGNHVANLALAQLD